MAAKKKAAKKVSRKAPARKAAKARRPAKKVQPIPKGYHAVTPNLVVRDCSGAIDFYKKVFGAKELSRMPTPDGRAIWHAELRIGDSIVFTNDAMPGMESMAPTPERPSPTSLWIYAKDADEMFDRAVKAGCAVVMPMMDMFWGDRSGQVKDPYGYLWGISKHVKDMTPKQMAEAGKAFAESQKQQQPPQPQATGNEPQTMGGPTTPAGG